MGRWLTDPLQYGPDAMHTRNALAEAREVAGPDAWVLEPSPPAVDDPAFFADDPAAAGFVLGGPPDSTWPAQFPIRDAPELGDVDAPLAVDADASALLGAWYGFAWSVLEALREDAESEDAGRVQLWPEHFDAGVEC